MFIPNLLRCLECGVTKLGVYKMVNAVYGRRPGKTRFYMYFSTFTHYSDPPILKVVRNSFQTFHLVDSEASLQFRYEMIVHV